MKSLRLRHYIKSITKERARNRLWYLARLSTKRQRVIVREFLPHTKNNLSKRECQHLHLNPRKPTQTHSKEVPWLTTCVMLLPSLTWWKWRRVDHTSPASHLHGLINRAEARSNFRTRVSSEFIKMKSPDKGEELWAKKSLQKLLILNWKMSIILTKNRQPLTNHWSFHLKFLRAKSQLSSLLMIKKTSKFEHVAKFSCLIAEFRLFSTSVSV